MGIPGRLQGQEGTHALVDGIAFPMPIETADSQAFLVAYTIDADRAAALLPGRHLHPYRLGRGRGVLLVTVVNYEQTDIGRYIEFSLGIACTHGDRPAPPLLPGLLRRPWGLGQYVVDLPVSTEISVKGGKGIWGMPKHQASLDFLVDDRRLSSQYDLDGRLAIRIDVKRPRRRLLPLSMDAANYCEFRGMLMKSRVFFRGQPRFSLFPFAGASLTIGDHPRVAPLRDLGIAPRPLATIFYPDFGGVLDDHVESWFVTNDEPPAKPPEGMESVVHLGLSREWPPPPERRA